MGKPFDPTQWGRESEEAAAHLAAEIANLDEEPDTRMIGCILRMPCKSLLEAAQFPISEWRRLPNCGNKTIKELAELVLRATGITMKVFPDCIKCGGENLYGDRRSEGWICHACRLGRARFWNNRDVAPPSIEPRLAAADDQRLRLEQKVWFVAKHTQYHSDAVLKVTTVGRVWITLNAYYQIRVEDLRPDRDIYDVYSFQAKTVAGRGWLSQATYEQDKIRMMRWRDIREAVQRADWAAPAGMTVETMEQIIKLLQEMKQEERNGQVA
jgi:hypothetical protein